MTDRAPVTSPIRDIAFALIQRSLGERPALDRLVLDHSVMPMVDAVIDIEERFGIDLEADEIFRRGLTLAGLLDLVEARAARGDRAQCQDSREPRPTAQLFTLADFRRLGPATVRRSTLHPEKARS